MVDIQSYPKQKVFLPGNVEETVSFMTTFFIEKAQKHLQEKGFFSVALSGGSTPKKLYESLTKSPYKEQVDWSQVLLFWGDERQKPLTDQESNYYGAMIEGHLEHLPLRKEHIFPMHVEGAPEAIIHEAKRYEELIKNQLPTYLFDLVLLGVGEDGHTASLFPETNNDFPKEQLVAAHFVPKKKMWRMTLTFSCINQSRETLILALGKNKAPIVQKALKQGSDLPISQIGSPQKPALWIVDKGAAMLL
ncbi:MAG: 6-phosphogluconolactonase [Chlamydiota bacterium]